MNNTILGTCLHGSRLYGLATEASDWDYKSIFLPPVEDLLLMRGSRNIQTKFGEGSDKNEHESFALQEFLKLAANAEDIIVTMLHAGPEAVVKDSSVYTYLRGARKRFYTKRMTGSLGYARSQSAKYALRAERMMEVERVISLLETAQKDGVGRLSQYWDSLTEGEFAKKEISPNDRGEDKRVFNVAGKLLPATITPAYALDILYKLRDNYGDRVKAAKNMDGKDYKSLSHSFRVAYQLLHIYKDHGFAYPLPETEFIMAVKTAKMDYLKDSLDNRLNELMLEVEALAAASDFPEKVDQKWMDQIALGAYELGFES